MCRFNTILGLSQSVRGYRADVLAFTSAAQRSAGGTSLARKLSKTRWQRCPLRRLTSKGRAFLVDMKATSFPHKPSIQASRRSVKCCYKIWFCAMALWNKAHCLFFFAFFQFTHCMNTTMEVRKCVYTTIKPLNDIYGFSVCLVWRLFVFVLNEVMNSK